MKKFLMVMGAIFCGLIVLGIVALIFVAIRGTRLDKESSAYADAAIADIVTSWNVDAFFNRSSPELTRLVSANDGDRLFRGFRQLGRLKHCDRVKGQSSTVAMLGQPKRITAHYEAAAEFENGQAAINIDLIKHGDEWQVLGLHINSPTFLPK